MALPDPPRHRGDFHIAIICALPKEADAVQAIFDDVFREDKHSYRKVEGDNNAYTTGRIGKHNVVLARMPAMGKSASTSTAATFRTSFNNIRLALLVGICGGVPALAEKGKEMLLGDVIISTGIVQFDFGRQYPHRMVTKDTPEDNLARPSPEIRAFLNMLQGIQNYTQLREDIITYLDNLHDRDEFRTWKYPGADQDVLFSPTYRHKHHSQDTCVVCAKCRRDEDEVCERALELTCEELGCNNEEQLPRDRLQQIKLGGASPETASVRKPEIHFGRVASGDQIMKSGHHRDTIAVKDNLIGFEMEGTGIWDNLPTIVIKGVCDYADSHKNKKWQNYAAAGAAACTCALLKHWRDIDRPSHNAAVSDNVTAPANEHFLIPRILNPLFTGRTEIVKKMQIALSAREGSYGQQKRFVLTGLGGQGKSEICIKVANLVRQKYWGVFWIDVSEPSVAKTSLISVAKRLGYSAENLEDARHAFANTSNSWLLILDNADDPNFDYQVYFPPGNYGAIIMTSRVAECSHYGTVGSEAIDGLEESDSKQLLLNAANIPEQSRPSYDQHAKEVVELLGSHTLALIQAGTYIAQGHCMLDKYAHEYRRQRARLLKYWPKQGQSRYSNVYATFEASAEVLEHSNSEAAKDALCLLDILSMLHFSLLPTQIFEEAWRRSRFILQTDGSDTRDIDVAGLWHVSRLPKFVNVDSEEWETFRLMEAASLLTSLSLVTKDGSFGLSMHPLAHAWAKDRQESGKCKQSWINAGCIIALAGLWSDEFVRTRRQLQPHLITYLDIDISKAVSPGSEAAVPTILLQCGWTLLVMRDDRRLEQLLGDIFKVAKIDAANLDPSQKWLNLYRLKALNSFDLGQIKDTIELQEQANKIRERELSESHPDRLGSQHELAVAYLENGQSKEAIELLEQVVKIRSTLMESHPDRLASQHALARAYKENGQVEKAIELMEYVVKVRKRTLPEGHRSRLKSQEMLAIFFEALQVEVGNRRRSRSF